MIVFLVVVLLVSLMIYASNEDVQKRGRFEVDHCDQALEYNIRDFQEQNAEAVQKELEIVARQLKHWRAKDLERYTTEIMLANRGKCSYDSCSGRWNRTFYELGEMVADGKSKRIFGVSENVIKEMGYELAEWFQATLNKQGVPVKLYFAVSRSDKFFVWQDSIAYCQQAEQVKTYEAECFAKYGTNCKLWLYTLEPFGRHLIEPKIKAQVVIPKPYYEQTDDQARS